MRTLQNQNDGIVMYVRDCIDCTVTEPNIKEASCLLCKIGQNIAILAIYRSLSVRETEIFMGGLNEVLVSIKSYKTIQVIGDININIAPNNEDNRSGCYLNLAASHGLLPAHTFPTRLHRCLDHVLIKAKTNSVTLIIETYITDHLPTLVIIPITDVPIISKRERTKIHYESIRSELSTTDFSPMLKSVDPNAATDYLISHISRIIKTHTVTHKPPRSKRNIKPWITPGLLRCIRNRDNMHKHSKQHSNNIVLKITYLRYRNFLNKLLKKLKNEYNKNMLKNSCKNPKATWKAIKTITHMKAESKSPKSLLKCKTDPKQSVDYVNDYLSNIGSNLADKIIEQRNTQITSSTVPEPPPVSFSKSFAMIDVSSQEIDSLIVNLRRNCASGWDNISSRILQSSRLVFVPLLTHICRLCLTHGIFPNALKKAIIYPIYKSGDIETVDNYRPISLLPVLSKILEKVLNTRLINYLKTKDIIAHNQYGFREGKSTEDAVLALTSDIVDHLEKKNKCLCVFLDLSKAFDTVSNSLLLFKLEKIGIRGIALNLFTDYLTNRMQMTKIDDIVSKEAAVAFGIPQGSILGPTLFNIYINDLCKLKFRDCNIYIYADDTAILIHGSNWEEVKIRAESALTGIMSWLSSNLLTLNLAKTKFMPFSTVVTTLPSVNSYILKPHTCPKPSESCPCIPISMTTQMKYLGVYLDLRT